MKHDQARCEFSAGGDRQDHRQLGGFVELGGRHDQGGATDARGGAVEVLRAFQAARKWPRKFHG